MILLSIPQGMVTIGAAILSALILALASLTFGLVRFAVSVHGRLTALETRLSGISGYVDEGRISEVYARTDILWEHHMRKTPGLIIVRPPENPMKQERWNELTNKLAQEEISYEEAEEFLAALLKRREQAIKEKDAFALVLLDSGIVVAQWRIKQEELREMRDKKQEMRDQK